MAEWLGIGLQNLLRRFDPACGLFKRKCMKRIILLLFATGLFAVSNGYAQSNRTISGTVTSYDESSPLEGVRVWAKGSNKASGTQPDGAYYIEVGNADSILVFSYNGYRQEEVKLSGNNEYNIALHRQAEAVKDNSNFSATGKWRGVFTFADGSEVPFTFDVKNTADGKQKVYLLNGDERFESGTIKQVGDSLFIPLEPFDNELAFGIKNNTLAGVLRRYDGKGKPITVNAEKDKGYRFALPKQQPGSDISGTYDINFIAANGKVEKAVGLFTQDGGKLTGTFLRVTGDSRYLEGVVEGDHFYLSSFIGSSPAYYKGQFTKDGKLDGTIESPYGSQQFNGVLNDTAELPDPYALTILKDGYKSFNFNLPGADGKTVSLQDAKYKNKAVIVTITGSWCPNCMDEASFLAPWYKANRDRGVEIISIHYERQTDTAFVRNALTRFKKRFGIDYDQVFGGVADKQQVAASLPALNTFLAFPTTIFIDKKGNVAKIHTGYSGPATGKYYTAFVKDFNAEVDNLLQ